MIRAGRVFVVVLVLAAAGQAYLCGRRALLFADSHAAVSARLASDEPSFGSAFEAQAYHALPPLMALVPEDASVLLVSGVAIPTQFQFYVLPRPYRKLQRLEPKMAQVAAAARPDLAEAIHAAYSHIEQLGLRLTAAGLGGRFGTEPSATDRADPAPES
jgi:hypothetical protein